MLVTANAAAKNSAKTKTTETSATQFQYAIATNDATTRIGFQHYYDLDYDGAIASFSNVFEKHPDDPFAANHLLEAVLFKQLYEAGALETSIYVDNGFLNNRVPLHIAPETDQQIKELAARALALANQRIAADPRDARAYYARGVARGLAATYTAFVDKSWMRALGDAKGSRHDHQKALELDPAFSDARLVVGMHSYIVGSLPWPVRVLAHVVGEGGNKTEGLRNLRAAADGNGEASTDAKVVLELFLRRDQHYADALEIEQQLAGQHPRNFLFALERANVLKDAGRGPESVAAYRALLLSAQKGIFHQPQLEFAYFGLGEALKGQQDFLGAAEAYEKVASVPGANTDLRQRAELQAGQMYDLLDKRDLAIKKYESVIAQNSSSEQAVTARQRLRQPYHR